MSKELRIRILMDNAAFEEDEAAEVHVILTRAARIIEEAGSPIGLLNSLRDSNGNVCGSVEVLLSEEASA